MSFLHLNCQKHPEPFFALARELYPGQFKVWNTLYVEKYIHQIRNISDKTGLIFVLFIICIVQPTVCHYFIKLLKDKGLLRRCYSQVWKRQVFPQLFPWIYWHWYVCDQSEYWHSGARGWPPGRWPHWSSRNVLHVPLCQLLLPEGIHAGLDEGYFSLEFDILKPPMTKILKSFKPSTSDF